MVNYENGGYYGLLVLILSVLVISIVLMCISGMKNPPGFYSGVIVMIFSFFFLMIGLFGRAFVNHYEIFFWGIIGGLFIFIMCILIVGLFKKPSVNENFAEGICQKDGQMGYMVNGECMTSVSSSECQARLDDCNKKREQIEEECGNQEDMSEEQSDEGFSGAGTARSGLGLSGPVVGICEYEENNVRKFGYFHPNFGARCVSSDRMERMMRENPGKLMSVNATHSSNPFQSTACMGYPRDDVVKYDLACKSKFGGDYGVKLIEGFNCPENDFKGVCEKDYQMGEKLESNSTKCVPIGTDMNGVCQNKNLRDKKQKYLKMGYKEIKFSGCPEGTQRAICDGNYYDGKELYKNITCPFPQTENPDRKCKAEFGILSFAEEIVSDNCPVGYVRAKCKN